MVFSDAMDWPENFVEMILDSKSITDTNTQGRRLAAPSDSSTYEMGSYEGKKPIVEVVVIEGEG